MTSSFIDKLNEKRCFALCLGLCRIDGAIVLSIMLQQQIKGVFFSIFLKIQPHPHLYLGAKEAQISTKLLSCYVSPVINMPLIGLLQTK